MLSFQQIEQTASEFLKNFDGESFDFSEALDFLLEKFPPQDDREKEMTEKKLRNILDSADDGLARTFHGDRFYVLDRSLKGLVFRCKPRPFELEEGILIPGARFAPFHSPELFADDLEISSSFGMIPVREYTAPYEKVEELYFMLGPGGALDMFHAEKQDNTEAIMAAGGLKGALRLSQTVFDFSRFYREHNVRQGDLLKFTLDSYMNGTMKVEHEPRPDAPSPKAVQRWIEIFEKALGKVCRDYRDSFEIPAQIMYAYVYSAEDGTDLRRMPAPPIDTYHTMMQSIEFQRNGVDWVLVSPDGEDVFDDPTEPEEKETCACGHDHHNHDRHDRECACGHDHHNHDRGSDVLSPGHFTISSGSLDSMNAIFRELKTDLTETEFRARVFDGIASGIEDFEEFQRVCAKFFELEFQDEAQKIAFLNFAEDIWENANEIYSHHVDSLKAPLRQRLLDICEQCSEAEKDHSSDGEASGKLKSIRRDILDTLAVLSTDAVLEESDAEELELRIGDIEDELEDYL